MFAKSLCIALFGLLNPSLAFLTCTPSPRSKNLVERPVQQFHSSEAEVWDGGLDPITMSYVLSGFETVRGSVDSEVLRAKMAIFIQAPQMTNRLAFLGDRIIGLTVAQHLDRWRMDAPLLQRNAELYWTSAVLAEVFDEFRLGSPPPGDNGWSAHTKAQKVEALVAYLHKNATKDRQSAELFCRLMKHILDGADRRRGVVSEV